MKSWLHSNNTKIYSTHKERKYVVTKIFNGALKNKIYKQIIRVSKNAYTDKLDEIVDKCNYTIHRTIKMKPLYVKSVRILTLMLKIITKILNLKLVIMMKEYQNTNTFFKEKRFLLSYVINDLNGDEIVATFFEN